MAPVTAAQAASPAALSQTVTVASAIYSLIGRQQPLGRPFCGLSCQILSSIDRVKLGHYQICPWRPSLPARGGTLLTLLKLLLCLQCHVVLLGAEMAAGTFILVVLVVLVVA